MGQLTLAELRAADPEAFRSAAVAWAALAAALDTASDHVTTGRHHVAAAGHGWALSAATDRLAVQVDKVANTVWPARRIADALLHYADGLATLQRQLDAVLTAAQTNGLAVDLVRGTVTAPAPAAGRVYVDPQGTADAFRDELAEILTRARRLDTTTATAIWLARPDSPPADGPWVPDSPPPSGVTRLDRATVERQADRSPAAVAAWWRSLPTYQKEWALQDHPDLIGRLDGIPAVHRNRANRAWLDQLIEQGRASAGLHAVRDWLATNPDAYLLLIDGAGDGRVAVALGDPDHAPHTAVFVPGVGTELPDIDGNMARAARLYHRADLTTVDDRDVSVVYWLGYDPPDTILDGWREGPSREGGAALTRFVDGLRTTHVGGPATVHVTAIGHSYGSTVVAEGALAGDLRVDDIVAVGSPGLHSDHARELNIDPRHVWVGLSDTDEIRLAPEPIHGPEPADPDYGANRFETDTRGHGGYWRPDSQSLLNQAYIVTSQYDRVTLVHGEPPGKPPALAHGQPPVLGPGAVAV